MAMTLAASLVLALLAAAELLRCRSPLYPPVLFSALWSLLLLGEAVSGTSFYPLSPKADLLFVVGAVFFCVGALPVKVRHMPRFRYAIQRASRSRQARVTSAVDFGIVVLFLALPFYWRFLQAQSALSLDTEFWRGIRRQTNQTGLGIYAYLIDLGIVLSLIAVLHADGSKKMRVRITSIVGVTLCYSLLTVSRLSALTLVTGLIAVLYIRFGKVNWRFTAVAFIVSIVIFAGPAIVLHKGGNLRASVTDNAKGILKSLQLYTFGGLVAFDQVKDQPDSIFPTGYTFRFFLAIAHTIGIDVEVPEIAAPFTPTPRLQNVYTIYGSYFANLGWVGIILAMCLIGYVMTLLFRLASRRPEAVILYAVGFSGLVLSGFDDQFLLALSYWLQAALITICVFHRPLLAIRTTESPQTVMRAVMQSRGE